jgi:hypothetical protein
MRKITLIFVLTVTLSSCKSKTEDCIQSLMDEEGYTYEEACDECEEARIDSETRFE